MFLFLTFAVLTGCNGLRMGVGLKGVILDDFKLTLDGDTFDIRGRIGDSLLIVLNSNQDDKTPYYLLKYERNGFYYPQIGASDISTIDHTNNYVSIDDEKVYDIKNKKVLFSPPCGTLGLYYLGNWKDLQVFVNSDTICFSDGKCIGLQYDVFCRRPQKNGMVTLITGAQTKEISFADLYNAKKKDDATDISVEHFKKNYFIKPRSQYERMEAGFNVELDIPKGDAEADKAIREWMMAVIRDDVFSLLKNNRDVPVGKCASLKEMKLSLDGYGALWEKLCRAENQIGDTLEVRMLGDIIVKKVADCDDYTT